MSELGNGLNQAGMRAHGRQRVLRFVENNKDSAPGEVDLHGLFVKEAIEFSEQAIKEAQQRGESEVHLIVGAFVVCLFRLIESDERHRQGYSLYGWTRENQACNRAAHVNVRASHRSRACNN